MANCIDISDVIGGKAKLCEFPFSTKNDSLVVSQCVYSISLFESDISAGDPMGQASCQGSSLFSVACIVIQTFSMVSWHCRYSVCLGLCKV